MSYIPHEKLAIHWNNKGDSFGLSLPWLSMEIDVEEEDKGWIQDATNNLQSSPLNKNVQRFITQLKDYPVSYIQPRNLEDFKGKDLQPCPNLSIDTSTPPALLKTFGCPIADELKNESIPAWTWDWEKVLGKARIPGTDLYDPVSLISYLICDRLEWESTTWLGQDGFGQFLQLLDDRLYPKNKQN